DAGVPVETARAAEHFRFELLLTPALALPDLVDRVSRAFEVPLAPLQGGEAGTFFGNGGGLQIALQAGDESRRVIVGGERELDPGPGDENDRAAAWALQKLLVAGVAARKPE
ncbi:MAG: hypothetical protein HYY18_18420, partial [Planctomycetes bacterium]|nr:hypothetical protein [Planctomycetota bacterium]